MPRYKAILPSEDPKIDLNEFQPVDSKDPRALGEGPCRTHAEIYATTDPQTLELLLMGGNGYGRWAQCRKCGLVLGYWPVHGCTGDSRQKPKAVHVRRALAMMAESSMPPSAKIMRSYIKMAQEESKLTEVKVGSSTKGSRRTESSPPVGQSQTPWAPLTPRARRPPGTSSPQKAQLLENQLEVMVMREQALKAESAAAQRKAEEREQLLLERLAALERNMGMCAPSAPDPELMAPGQSNEFSLVQPLMAENLEIPGLHEP